MSDRPAAPNPTPPGDDPADSTRWARPVLERQVGVLGQVAEAGLEVILALRDQALAPSTTHPIAQDIGLAYTRVSRAVRLTLALQAKVIEDIKALDQIEGALRQAQTTPADARRNRVQRIVERVIEAEHDDPDTIDRLAQDSCKRLDDEDLSGDVLARPMSETVALICEDLGLSPDWTRLALEAWALQEVRSGAVGAPLAHRMAEAAPHPGTSHPQAAVHAASP